MSAYMVAAYLVVLGSLAGYALHLHSRRRALEREAHANDTLPRTEEA